MIVDQHPPDIKLQAFNSYQSVFAEASEGATSAALHILKNKKEYWENLYACSVDRIANRLKGKMPQSIEEFRDISMDETTACYDVAIAPYIDKESNKYSKARRYKIIEETTDMHIKVFTELTENKKK